MPPLSPEVQASRAVSGSDEDYTRYVRAMLQRFPDVVVLDARRAGDDGSIFIDALHLDKRAAKILTTDIAREVADRLRRPEASRGWVEMPPLGPRVAELARAAGDKIQR